MFEREPRRYGPGKKWAKAAGDHAVLSAAANERTGQYIGDLDL